MTYVRASVLGSLVETYSSNIPIEVGAEPNAVLTRRPVSTIYLRGRNRRDPITAGAIWGAHRYHRGGDRRNFKIGTVIGCAALEHELAQHIGSPHVGPALASNSWMPSCSAVQRNLYAADDSSSRI